MTNNSPAPRQRTVPGLEHEVDDIIAVALEVGGSFGRSLDAEVRVIIYCTAALAHYVDQLHSPHRFDQFLTPAECGQVAAFIDSLGPNPARKDEFVTKRSALGVYDNPATGWVLEDIRTAEARAEHHRNDPNLPEYAQQSLALLQALITYLDSFHGTSGLREFLTREERAKVGQYVSQILDQPPAT